MTLLLALTMFVVLSSDQALAQSGNDLRQRAVFVQTDGLLGNRVIAYFRHPDGTLTQAGRFATGGLGTGAHLISGGSVTLANINGNPFLFVINTLTSDISVFSVRADRLVLVEREPSGVIRAHSTTVHGNLLYVLGELSASINGFRVDNNGRLTQIPGSKRFVTGAPIAEPAQVLFSNDGAILAVADENTSLIDTFVVDPVTGLTQGPIPNFSFGINPFAMIFDENNHLLVTSGGFDLPKLSFLSTFNAQPGGTLQVISPFVGNERQFACWVGVTRGAAFPSGGQYAYVTNTGDSTVSSYLIRPDGSATLVNSVAGTGAAFPLLGIVDNGVSSDNKYMYASSFTGNVNAWAIQDDGGLVPIQQVNGLPLGTAGMAVR